jgi:hypothetical protein
MPKLISVVYDIMPLPLFDLPTLTKVYATLRQNDYPRHKHILGNYTHTSREDRISQRTWYENVTYADEIREFNRANNLSSFRLNPPK